MVLIKIALVGIAVIAILAVSKQQHWFERAGVTAAARSSLPRAAKPAEWWTVPQGVLTGFPNLAGGSVRQPMGYAGDDAALAVHDSAEERSRLSTRG